MKNVLFLLFAFISLPLYAAQSIVILPFSDESKNQQVYWLGEGFAESLSEEMFLTNAYIIQRPERKAAYDALRLPYIGHVSRATMLKLGQNLGVDYIVFGVYSLQAKNLKVQARVIKTSSSMLSATIEASGLLDNLYNIQGSLKKGLKDYFAAEKLAVSENNAESSSVPLHAYELYIKGLLETSDQEKVQFFQRAIAAHADYPQAIYRLGLALFRSGRFKESNEALGRIRVDGIARFRADFLTALNIYFLRDLTVAAQKWYQLSQRTPTPEIYNNIGISLVGNNEIENAISYLSKAVELDRDNPDLRFNLAIGSFQKGAYADASRFFREAVELQPSDYQAYYWLSRSLERAQKPESKQVLAMFQERLPGDQKGKFPEQHPDVTPLLRPSLTYLAKEEKDYFIVSRVKSIKQRADYVKTYQASARKQIDEEHPERAILEVKKGISFSPFDWYLHHLWGLALNGQGAYTAAIEQLQFALWCMDNVESHILLAEIYKDTGQYAESKKHIQQVLALDPKHKRAIEIWGKIHNKT